MSITKRYITGFVEHGTGNDSFVCHVVEWVNKNRDYASELSDVAGNMQVDLVFTQGQLRDVLNAIGKCTGQAKRHARSSLLASIALASATTTEPIQKFVNSGVGSVDFVQHMVSWARENQQFSSSMVSTVVAVTTKVQTATNRSRHAVGTMLRYLVETDEYEKKCIQQHIVPDAPLIAKTRFLSEVGETTTSNLTKFTNGRVCGDAIVQKIIVWVDNNPELIARADQHLATWSRICQTTMTTNQHGKRTFTDAVLHQAVSMRLEGNLSLRQTSVTIAGAAGIAMHSSYVPRTPGRGVIRMAEMALAGVLMSEQSKDFRLAVVTGVGVDGGEATDISTRKACIFRRAYCWTKCTAAELEQCQEEVVALCTKPVHTKAEKDALEWLELVLRIGGRPTNYTCGAVVAEHETADAHAYKVAILGVAGPEYLDFDTATITFALGDAASVISAGVDAAAEDVGHNIERLTEVHHGWARMAKVSHRVMHNCDVDTESTIECYWRAAIKVIRAHWPTFRAAYKRMCCSIRGTDLTDIDEIERAMSVMDDRVNMPTTFAKTRFLGFQKSVAKVFPTVERLQIFLATTKYLVTQDIANGPAWEEVTAGIAAQEVQLAVMLEAAIYKEVYKDPHLSALQFRGWVAPFVPRWLHVMKHKLITLSNTLEDTMVATGLREWIDERGMRIQQNEMCDVYGQRALAQLQIVFACYSTGVVQFAGIGDSTDLEWARSELRRFDALCNADPDIDQLGLLTNREEVAQVLAGTNDGEEFTIYDTVHMKRVYVINFWGAIRVTSQDVEGDVKELGTMGKGIRMSVIKKSQIVCLRRDAHADRLSRKLVPGQCEAGIRNAFAEARLHGRQDASRRVGCYDDGGGVYQDIEDIFIRVNTYLHAACGENYLQLVSQSDINSAMYHQAHEAVLGPHDTAAIRAHMRGCNGRPPSAEEIKALIAIGSSGQKDGIIRKYVSGGRRSKPIPLRFVVFKYLAAELLTLEDPCLHAMQGGLYVNPSNVLTGGTIENFVYDSRTGTVNAIAFLKVRIKPNTFQGERDHNIRAKANEMMGNAGVHKCYVVEVFVRHDAEKVLIDAYNTGAKINLEPFVARQAVQMHVSIITFSEAIYKPIKALHDTFIRQQLVPVLQAGIDQAVPGGVNVKKYLDSNAARMRLLDRESSAGALGGEPAGMVLTDGGAKRPQRDLMSESADGVARSSKRPMGPDHGGVDAVDWHVACPGGLAPKWPIGGTNNDGMVQGCARNGAGHGGNGDRVVGIGLATMSGGDGRDEGDACCGGAGGEQAGGGGGQGDGPADGDGSNGGIGDELSFPVGGLGDGPVGDGPVDNDGAPEANGGGGGGDGGPPGGPGPGDFVGDNARFFWNAKPDDATKPPPSIDMVQVAWEDGGEARYMSRCGIMVAVTLVRMLLRDLPKGICVHGISGSAKSTMAIRVVKEIMAASGYASKRVSVVAPTNKAAFNAGNENANNECAHTIHKFFGIDLAEEDAEFYISRLLGRERTSRAQYYRNARQRMQETFVLIIDEISMVSQQLLLMMDKILRAVRNCQEAFGGITLIVIGDTTQLGPVTQDENGRTTSSDKEWFFRVRLPGQRGGPTMGIDSVLPNKVVGHEQYRAKCADLYEVIRFIRWGGHGDWTRVAPLLKSRRKDAVGVNQNSDAFAAVPTKAQAESINNHRYKLVKEKTRERDPHAREESYGVRAYVLQHTAAGDEVQPFENLRNTPAKERLEGSMQLHDDKQLLVISGAKYMITKRTEVVNRVAPFERFVVQSCDVVVAVGFVTDDSVDVPAYKDVNNERSGVYPVMRDIHDRQFVLLPKDTLIGEDEVFGELRVVHMAICLGYAGTTHVMQSTTIRDPNQLQIDLCNNFCSGQGYVSVGRVQRLSQLITNGLNASSIFLSPSVRCVLLCCSHAYNHANTLWPPFSVYRLNVG
jgi:hypothetical protein